MFGVRVFPPRRTLAPHLPRRAALRAGPSWSPPLPRSFLTVHRPDGRRVVAVTDAEQLHSVRSGQRVRVGGRWMKHPGRSPADEDGPAEPVNDGGWGCRGAKRCMRAATISRIEDTTTPVWQQETSDAGEPSAANAPRGQYPPARARLTCARSFVSVQPMCGVLRAVLCRALAAAWAQVLH